jgi:hypothetical protein
LNASVEVDEESGFEFEPVLPTLHPASAMVVASAAASSVSVRVFMVSSFLMVE